VPSPAGGEAAGAFPLGSTVPCGVRTFLAPTDRDAAVRPAHDFKEYPAGAGTVL